MTCSLRRRPVASGGASTNICVCEGVASAALASGEACPRRAARSGTGGDQKLLALELARRHGCSHRPDLVRH